MWRRAAAAALVLAAACGSGGPTPPGALPECRARSQISVGQRLPDCSFAGLDGTTVSLASFRGKPLVLNFWAEWCVACTREMPDLERIHDDVGERVAILGMDLLGIEGETTTAARGFAERTGVTYPLAFDPDGLLYGHFGNSLRVTPPLTVFVGPDGRMAGLHFGRLTEARLRTLIGDLLDVR